ncbi:MAG: HAMP domain-containing sensor histidine kinase, partial [Marmoricola sp.]
MIPRRSGLTPRLILAMVGVATVAFLFAALLTAPLVRSAAQGSARGTLGRQADLLAQLPRAARLTERLDARADVRGLFLGVVTPRGRSIGAASALTPGQLAKVRSGGDVSGTGVMDGRRVLVEARPVRNGGAVVLATIAGDVDRAVDQQRRRHLLALALGLLVALTGGVVMASYLGRPLARLASTARRMGAGERGAPLPESGTREVAEVADALRQLDVALQTSEERQRRFLLSVSHELRTPLTAIRGYAESLVDGATGPDEVPAVGETMVRESQRLARYVEDLLALARLEADDFDFRTGPVDLAEVVDQAASAWSDRCTRAHLQLVVERPSGPLVVESDAVRVRQVLDALTDNAVRVCPAGASVVLAAASTATGARLEVRDSGPGLTEADAAIAFEPSALHDKYAGRRPGGQGLGLAIAHRLVTRLGGTVRLERAIEG